MEKKIKILLEIIIIIIAITYYIVKIMMKKLKNMYGSSDRIVNPDKCVNIIEINWNEMKSPFSGFQQNVSFQCVTF